MLDSIELRIARSKISRYEHEAHDRLIIASKQAQDCMDCEAFLDGGIAALEWLERSEEVLHVGMSEGVLEITPDIEEAIESLHVAWLRPCAFAEKWIAKCQRNGFTIHNLEKFRECCERAREWLDRNEFYRQSKAAREERFAQEPW